MKIIIHCSAVPNPWYKTNPVDPEWRSLKSKCTHAREHACTIRYGISRSLPLTLRRRWGSWVCVNLPLSFDHGWWDCRDKAAERAEDRWEASVEGVKGLGTTTGDCETERKLLHWFLCTAADCKDSLSCAKNEYWLVVHLWRTDWSDKLKGRTKIVLWVSQKPSESHKGSTWIKLNNCALAPSCVTDLSINVHMWQIAVSCCFRKEEFQSCEVTR